MKISINSIAVMLIFFNATSAFAINGDLLIGLGAKSRGMGGLGIAKSHGAESAPRYFLRLNVGMNMFGFFTHAVLRKRSELCYFQP